MGERQSVLVLTFGNRLAGDDGVGALVADALRREPLDGVHVIEAGHDPATLLDEIDGHEQLVIVDALMDPDVEAGTVLNMDWYDPARPAIERSGAVSSHAWPVSDVLELAGALGRLPRQVHLIMVSISKFGPVSGISPAVAGAVGAAVEAVRTIARRSTAARGGVRC